MHLLNPIFLIGILGITLPIIIHLMGRQKATPYRFAAIDFILRSQKRIEARLKLQHLLLLLLRAGVILLIALALTRPLLQKQGIALLPTSAPSCNIFLIDNSLSMDYRTGEGTFLSQAKALARDMINSLSPSDEGCVLEVCTFTGLPDQAIPNSNKGKVLESLERIAPSFYSTPLDLSIEKSLSLLNTSKKELKRIFIFTDLTKNSWKNLQKVSKYAEKEPVIFNIIDLSKGRPLPNLAIVGLESNYDWTKKDGKIHLKVTVHNFSGTPLKDLLVKVKWGDEPVSEGKGVTQGFLDLAPNSQAVKEFFIDPPQESTSWGYVEVVEAGQEGLFTDNQRYFTLPVVKDIPVLLVDGAPSMHLYQSESFYLERALNPNRLRRSFIRSTIVIPQEIGSVNFKDFELVMLANVGELTSVKLEELNTYVKEGGRVLFSLGSNIRAEYYNANFSGLIPKLRMAVEADVESGLLRFGPINMAHPILKVFTGESLALLEAPSFSKVFLVEPQTVGSVNTILTFSNGAPALLEMHYGKGRTMLFTSTFDRDWTDLPVKSIFLPLIQQMCRYLTDNLIEEGPGEVLVGQECEIPVFQDGASVEVLDPRGNLFKPILKPYPSRVAVISHTDYPGIYRLRSVESPDLCQVLAVNIDPSESDLSRIDYDQLRSSLGEERTNLGLVEPVRGVEGLVAGTRLWPAMLLAALGLLTLESFVTAKSR